MRRSSNCLSTALLTSTALTLIGVPLAPASAQERITAIEEITVTATRREETIYKTPINITALAAANMENLRLSNMSDVARFVPGLTLVDQGARGSSQLIVRGLSVANLQASEFLSNTNGETVGTYLGEIPYYLDLRLADIDRIEVLLGPQGTLYGAGTLGGAVRYIPNKPDTTAAGAQVQFKTYDLAHSSGVGFDGSAIINLPLVPDKLALRATASYVDDPGFIDYVYVINTPGVSNPQPDFTDPADVAANVTRKKDADEYRIFSGRVAVLGQFTDDLEATASIYFQDTRAGGRTVTSRAAMGTGPYDSALRFLEPSHRDNILGALELHWDLGFAKLTSATGYADYSEDGQRDQTDLLLNFEYGYEQFPAFAAFTREIVDEDRFNQELRLVSNNEGPFSWIVGGFYNYFKQHATSEEFTPGFPDFAGIDRPDNLEYFQITDQKKEEKAAFGELGYKITDWWQVTVGGRYYHYTDDLAVGFDLPLLSGDSTAINPTIQANKIKDDGFLYKVNTSFNITPEILLYGTVSEGFRLGGVNAVPPCLTPLPPGQNVCALPNEILIKPDQTLNKEIGIKGTALDGRVAFSLAVFHINWKDIQTEGRSVNGGVPITVNGGKAVSKGVEFGAQAKVTEEFSAAVTYSYTDAYLTTLAPGLVDGVDALPGDRTAGSPKHQLSLSLDYTRDLGNGYELGANYNVTYQSNVFTHVGLRSFGEALPGYDLHGASVSLATDVWKISLYADNLFDQFAVSSVRRDRSFIRSVNGFALRSFYEDVIRPRTVGVELKYLFGTL